MIHAVLSRGDLVKYSANAGGRPSGRRGTVLSALFLCAVSLPVLGDPAPGDALQSPPSSASPGLLARVFPLTATVDWLSVSYYVTSQSYYDIDVEAVDLGRAWRLGSILELQGRLGAFHAQGERLDAPYLSSEDSTTSGATFGGAARVYAYQLRRMRLFIEGSVEILYTPGGNQFPPGGTGVNAFLRAGG